MRPFTATMARRIVEGVLDPLGRERDTAPDEDTSERSGDFSALRQASSSIFPGPTARIRQRLLGRAEENGAGRGRDVRPTRRERALRVAGRAGLRVRAARG